jgi:enoyl-CoA hydratase
MSEPVLYRENDGVSFITLNRPEKLNALNPTVFRLLGEYVESFATSTSARVLVIHGEGTSFAAGADIEHYVDLEPARYGDFMRSGAEVQQRFVECPKPIIAAVHGYALGGGLEVALVCDIMVVEPTAELGLPEVRLGLLPGGGGTQRLPRRIGPVRAAELIMTGRRFTGVEAVEWGLALGLGESGSALEAATALAERIARQAPGPVQHTKVLLRSSQETSLEVGLKIEQTVGQAIFATEDGREGVRAFAEKRRPEFGKSEK